MVLKIYEGKDCLLSLKKKKKANVSILCVILDIIVWIKLKSPLYVLLCHCAALTYLMCTIKCNQNTSSINQQRE